MYIYRVGKRGQVSGKKRVGANQQYKGMRAGEKEQKEPEEEGYMPGEERGELEKQGDRDDTE